MIDLDKQDSVDTEIITHNDNGITSTPVVEENLEAQDESQVMSAVSWQESAEADKTSSKVKNGSSSQPWVLLIVGLLVGGLGGFYLHPLIISDPEPLVGGPLAAVEDSGQINEAEPHRAVMMAVIAGARHFYGDANAPVTLVEFGDFNCGYCGQWARDTLPLIDEKYIQTGKVRMAYVHYPILGDDSMTAAEATECAAEQDHFWDYHNLLYAHQGIGFTPDNLVQLAENLDLDTSTFETCLSNFVDRASLDDDIRLAQVMGVRGTPAFLLNGIPLAGAYPYEDFVQVIDGILAGKF